MLTDLVKGKTAAEVAALPKEELLDEVGIPLTPGAAQVRDPRARRRQGRAQPLEGDAAPRGMAGPRHWLSCASAPLEELPPGTMKLVEHEPLRDRCLQLRRRAARDRGSLHPRRRPALPRQLGRRDVHGRLPAPRRQLRPRERAARSRCPPTCRRGPSRCASRTGSSSVEIDVSRVRCFGPGDPRLPRLPRRGVGPAGARRARDLRAALPRGVPVGALVADDPAQAAGVPARPSPASTPTRSRASATATSSGCSPTPAIVRHRGKIEAAIANARATVALRAAGDAAGRALLGARARAGGRAPRRRADWPAHDARVGRARPAPAPGGLPLRRADDGLRRHAGLRRRQRPPRELPGARRGRAGAGAADARRARPRRPAPARGRRPRARRAPAFRSTERSLQIAPTSGALLYALCAGRPGCAVLEIGGSRGYSTIWLGAAVRARTAATSPRSRPTRVKLEALGARTSPTPGSRDWIEVIAGRRVRDARAARRALRRRLPRRLEGRLRGALRARARPRSTPGAVVVADNVLSHAGRSPPTRPPARPIRASSASPFRSTTGSS